MGRVKSWLMDQEENNFNFPCDDCGDIIKAGDGEASFETRNGTYVCEVCIDNSRGDWPEMREMLEGTGVDVSDIRAWVAKGNRGVAARNAAIEASKREAARPMEDMLDDVFSKVLGDDW